jgi:predicted secreted hydrolase
MSAEGLTRRGLLVGAALAPLLARPAAAQGFSGLGADAAGFAPVTRGRALAFPADHGAHPDYRIEWWYLTANLQGDDGQRYGAQWTLFRSAGVPDDRGEGFRSRQLWMAHAAVTSATAHRFAERYGRGGVGQAGVGAAPFAAFIDDWRMGGAAPDPQTMAPLQVRAAGADFAYDLALTADKPLVRHGEAGFSVKSPRGQASYYYSQPFFRAAGTLRIDGAARPVTGTAWFDHEWSSQPLAADQSGWDWFSLHLADGRKLMLFRLRQTDGGHFHAGTLIAPDGATTVLASDDIVLTPGATAAIGTRRLPVEWSIAVTSQALALQLRALNPQSWMGTRVAYWEGPVSVTGAGDGIGYLEMTGY